MRPSTMVKRQQQLEVGARALGGARRDAGDDRDRLVGDRRDERADGLAAKQCAHPRPGESERVAGLDVEPNDETVAENVTDRARLDVAALGRAPRAAARISNK